MAFEFREFQLRDDFIELHKLLKLEDFASSGGEAKALVASALVQVNGETETRKRRKLVLGDEVMIREGERRVCIMLTRY